MGKRIVMIGAGAVGGYVGGHLANSGADVTLIDFWHANVEAIRKDGVQLSGMTPEETCTARPRTLHFHEVANLAKEAPVDIAFLSLKSYDTEWASMMIRPYLSEHGFVVSLQNCINEERVAKVVGWGRTIGCIAARISVELYEPGKIRRQAPKGSATHTVFRVGEVHGRITARIEELVELLSRVDGAKATSNLWGERWSKLCHNSMRNGISAATGLTGPQIDQHDHIRHLCIRLGAEAAQVGMAHGFAIEKVGKIPSELLAAAVSDRAAFDQVDQIILSEGKEKTRGALQRPSMGQDMMKGRRTEIGYLNGYVSQKGVEIGLPTPNNDFITDLVTRVERGELKPSVDNIPKAARAA